MVRQTMARYTGMVLRCWVMLGLGMSTLLRYLTIGSDTTPSLLPPPGVAALPSDSHKQAASTGGANLQPRGPARWVSLVAPVRARFLGEMDGALGEFHELFIGFCQPHRAPIFHESGLDDDTVLPAATEASIGTVVMIQPVAMHRPEERWQAKQGSKQPQILHGPSPL